MNGALKTVLSLSFSGSLLIVALLLCRPLVKNRFSRRWQYYIWLVAVARLLLPFTPETSLAGLLFREEPAAQITLVSGGEDIRPEQEKTADSDGSLPAPPQDAGTEAPAYLWLIWPGVALALLIRKVTLYQSFAGYIRAGSTQVSDIALLDQVARLGAQTGVKRPVELYTNSLAASPLLLGFFRPCIVLPTAALPAAELQYTIRHELTHCKRGDMAYKWLVQLAVCLHWFNPLVWLMGREISRACELACDEAVTAGLDEAGRRAYGDTLIHAMGVGGSCQSAPASLSLSESAELLKERLQAIMEYRRPSKWTAAASFLLAAVLMMGAAAAGAYPGTAADDPEPDRQAGSTEHRYTQEGYYQAPYLFEIGWNLWEDSGYARQDIPLPEGGTMTVYAAEPCQGDLRQKAIRSALAALLSRLKRETADTQFPLTRPLVVSIRNIGNAAPANLAEQYYREGAIPQFGAMFGLLDEAGQRTLLEEIYDSGQIDFFSIALRHLPANSPLPAAFAEKAYTDGEIGIFSILAGQMDRPALETWLDRAAAEKRNSFRSVLLTALGDGEGGKALEAELDAKAAAEYKAHGITKSGKSYYYQNQLTRIFMDVRQDSSFYTLEINPLGTVDLKVTRDSGGSIERVAYMDKAEAAALLGDWDEDWEDWDEPEEAAAGTAGNTAPVAIASMEGGELIWLKEYELAYGDHIQYDLAAETGDCLQIGFVKPGDTSLNVTYFSLSNRRSAGDGELRCSAGILFKEDAPVEPGRYQMFLYAPEGPLTDVSGSVSVTPAAS